MIAMISTDVIVMFVPNSATICGHVHEGAGRYAASPTHDASSTRPVANGSTSGETEQLSCSAAHDSAVAFGDSVVAYCSAVVPPSAM